MCLSVLAASRWLLPIQLWRKFMIGLYLCASLAPGSSPSDVKIKGFNPLLVTPLPQGLTARVVPGAATKEAKHVCNQITDSCPESLRPTGVSAHVKDIRTLAWLLFPSIAGNHVNTGLFGRPVLPFVDGFFKPISNAIWAMPRHARSPFGEATAVKSTQIATEVKDDHA